VSDAGTPGINDPGFDLVRACAATGIEVVAIPGPWRIDRRALDRRSADGSILLRGFLPARGAARRSRLDSLALETRTLVFYESPHRVREALEDCAQIFGGERPAAVARELTKVHETLYRGALSELAARAAAEPAFVRGEIVLVIAGASPPPSLKGADGTRRGTRPGARAAARRASIEAGGAFGGTHRLGCATTRL